MKKVVCFCRVSSKTQDLDNQRDTVLESIRKDGFSDDEVVIVEGKESAIKLDEEERETLKELNEVIKRNPTIKSIYFYAIDRLARKVSIVLSVVEKMSKKGINLHFLNPYPMQTMRDGKEDAMGKMFLTFLSIGAEMEMKMKKERFNDAIKIMREQGKLVVGKVLYGYYRDNNGFPQVKEDEKNAVRIIFKDYLNGKSMRSIAKRLITENYFDGTNLKSLNSAIVKVSNIINNPAYSGRTPLQKDSKQEKQIKYPAIIDAETQDKAIKLASNNKKEKDTTNIYYAKGLVKFLVDDKYYIMTPVKGNTSYCFRNDDGEINVNINVIDTIVWREAQILYQKFGYSSYLKYPNVLKEKIKENKNKLKNLEPIFDKLKETKKRLGKLYTLGRLEDDEYDLEFEQVKKDEKEYISEKLKLEREIEKYQDLLKEETDLKNKKIDFSLMNDEERRDLIKKMISDVIVERLDKNQYRIIIGKDIPLVFSLSKPVYYYSCLGGVKKLIYSIDDKEYDISSEILNRFKPAYRKKKRVAQ